MANVRPPEKINFQEPRWDVWRSSFQTFRIVTKLDEEADDIQIATLKYSMGAESDAILKGLHITDTSKNSYDEVLAVFDNYFKPRKNLVQLRSDFQGRVQAQNEGILSYHKALKETAELCDFTDPNERILDQLVFGLNSKKLKEKIAALYMTNPIGFTLEKILDYCKTHERSQVTNYPRPLLPSLTRIQKDPSIGSMTCGKCGAIHFSNRCPALGKECSRCHKLNHYTSMCQGTPKPTMVKKNISIAPPPRPNIYSTNSAMNFNFKPP